MVNNIFVSALSSLSQIILIVVGVMFLLVWLGLWDLSMFPYNYCLILCIVFAGYWLVSIFIFLSNRGLYASYTSVIQRFWKRSLYLFWILELFLFSIYLFLLLNAPAEVEWLFDQSQLFSSQAFSGSLFFGNVLLLLSLIVIIYVLQCLVNLTFFTNLLYLGLGSWGLSLVLWGEFVQTYTLSLSFNGLKLQYSLDEGLWQLTGAGTFVSGWTNYILLLAILKFWHTIFIAGVYFITVMVGLSSVVVSRNTLSINKQNLFFLFGFGFIFSAFLLNGWLNVVYEYPYTWFFLGKGVTLVSTFDVFVDIATAIV